MYASVTFCCEYQLCYLACVVWQVGKLREIEEAGHNPQMLAQHGILLDTDLHQDPSSQTGSGENKRWEAKESCNRTQLYMLASAADYIISSEDKR